MRFRKAEFFFVRIIIPVLLVWLMEIHAVTAQHLGYRRYTVDDGLVQSEVVLVFQDSRGFIWTGTKFGVSCFDGSKFVTRFDNLGTLKSSIRFINELSDGSVIAASSTGYAIFAPDGKMSAFKYPVFNSVSIISYWVSKGEAYVAFREGQKILIIKSLDTGPLDVTSSLEQLVMVLKSQKVQSVFYDEQFNCYYILDYAQQVFSFSGNKLKRINIPPSPGFCRGQDGYLYAQVALSDRQSIGSQVLDSADTYLKQPVGTGHRIYRLKGSECLAILEFKTSKPLEFANFVVSKTGKIIVADHSAGKVLFFNHGTNTSAKLDFNFLSSMFIDDENTLWMGTANGLMHIYPEYFINFTQEESLYPDTQSVLCDRNGTIWAASFEYGLQFYQKGKFVKKMDKNLIRSELPRYFFPGSRVDHLGRIHFCINPYFTMIWDGDKMELGKNCPKVASMFFYDDTVSGKYYYGCDAGLAEQLYGKDSFMVYPVFPGNTTASKIVSIVRASDGKLMLGGFKALITYDGLTFEKLPNSVHPDITGANAMEKDIKGNIWIGNGNGLYFYNNKEFLKIKNEYFNDLVLSLQLIDSTKLLIGGIRGIGILDLVHYYRSGKIRIRYFDKNNGFLGGECQQNCISKDHEGFYWIGASNGIVRLDAGAVPYETPAPRVYLSKAYTYDERLDWKPLSISDFAKRELELSYDNNNIRFEFTGISFSSPGNLEFSYKLEGFDQHWSISTTDRKVSYTNLPPGKFIFKVKACSDAGVWSEKAAEFRVTSTPAFWQTWYFYLFVFLTIVALMILGISHFLSRRNRILREHIEDERRFAELQFKTLRNQLAPHFVFNALNAIGSSIYQDDKEKSYDFLQRFATLIRSTLVNADKTYRTLNEEVEFVRNYLDLEKFRFENKFDYAISMHDSVNPNVQVPKMIIQTFAENAVKHGLVQKTGKGMLSIMLESEQDYLTIIIEDNGIGRSESMKYNTGSTSKGMEIITEFIALFNRFNEKKVHFEVTDIPGNSGEIAGTRVIIKLPIVFTYNSITKPT
ncbi:MAG: histidine kinase [Bacteroidota bacterium]